MRAPYAVVDDSPDPSPGPRGRCSRWDADADPPYVVHRGDCVQVMRAFVADASVDLIATDPPYFQVKEEWDNQWATADDFLAWLDTVLAEFQRVLRPDGSLYLFASPRMAARVECLVGTRFNVLTHVVWRKGDARSGGTHARQCKEALRSYFPQSERIIFAEHGSSDRRAAGEAGYEAACDQLRGRVFEPLRAYFDDARRRSGLSSEQIREAMHRLTGKRYVFERHTFSTSQWEMPTREQYDAARLLFSGQVDGFPVAEPVDLGEYDPLVRSRDSLGRDYATLRREYDDLREQYEALRRPFNVSAEVPFTDVWDKFPPVQTRPGKHPCEKPEELWEHVVRASSRPGALVLDAFCGSGSCGSASLRLGRRWVGIDSDERWARSSEARCARALGLRA